MSRLPIGSRLLLGFLLVAVLPLAGLGLFYSATLEHALTATVLQNLASIADKKAEQIDVFVGERLADVQIYSHRRSVRQALLDYTQAFHESDPAIDAEGHIRADLAALLDPGMYYDLLLIDTTGNVVFSVAQEADLGSNLLTGPYRDSGLARGYRQAMAWLQADFTPFEAYAPSNNRVATFLVAPVLEAGRQIGAIALQVNVDALATVASDRTGLGRSGETVLAQRVGDDLLFTAPLRHIPDAAFRHKVALALAPSASRMAQDGERGKGLVRDYAGMEVAAVWRYLPGLHWGMVVKIDVEEVLARAYEVQRLVWFVLAFVLGVSSLIAGRLGRSLARPVNVLTQVAERIAAGEAHHHAPVFSGPELARLAQAFNRMVDREATARANLEDKVQKRTADLERLNAMHSAILDHAAYAIISATTEGAITTFNRAAEVLTGYRAEEMLGRTPAILHDPEEVAARARQFGEELGLALAPGFDVFVVRSRLNLSNEYEWTYIRKDGSRFPVLLSVTALRDKDGTITGYLGIAIDISERHQAAALLQENVQHTQAILDNVVDPIITIDEKGGISSFNQAAEAVFGYTAAEVLGRNVNMLMPPPYHAEHDGYLRNYLATGVKRIIGIGREVEGLRRNGSRFPMELAVSEIRRGENRLFTGIVRDIGERKAAEAALREQASFTQAILDNVVDGIITIDERGEIASMNRAAERIFGYPVAEVLGRNVNMLMPEPYHGEHDGYLQNYLSTGVARIIGIGREVVGLRRDGSCFPMDLAVSEIQHGGQRLFAGIVRDIGERKRVEQMKNQFVSTVSHELRTPLTSIAGSLGLLVGGALGEMPERAKQMLDIAHKNSLRLTHLINDLLDMEKIAAGKMQFDMQLHPLMPLIEQALEGNQAYGATHGVRFLLTGAAPDASVRVDAQRLMQVLSNFLSNAAKFSPKGDVVEVGVQSRDGRVRVAVTDHGPGIPTEFRARIFQKFSQADASDTRQKGGTGLGLAITKELVEHMGGDVGFDSVEGQGATFYFTLPLADPAKPDAISPTDSAAPRVLVVEDEADAAQLLCLMLQRAGYQVDVAVDGEAALRRLEQRAYVAMTLDLLLPDVNGLEIIQRVRNRPETAKLPIIVVSAKVEEGRLAINGDFAAIDWLPKPIDEGRLVATISQALPRGLEHKPQVLHVEDDADLHQVIRAMAGDRFQLELAATLAQARTMLGQSHYDVVILDLSLPDGSGWDLLPPLRELEPPPRVIILSGTELTAEEAAKVETALLKTHVSPQKLLDALSARIAGEKP